MITNQELEWASDLPLVQAYNIVGQYNRISKQIRVWPTTANVVARHKLKTDHPGICWLIDYKASHPLPSVPPYRDDYDEYQVRSRYIQSYLAQLRKS